MKKCIIAVLSLSMLLAMTGCKKDETTKAADESTTTTAAESTEEVTEDTAEQSSEASSEDTSASEEAAAVMSYADYAAAELDHDLPGAPAIPRRDAPQGARNAVQSAALPGG